MRRFFKILSFIIAVFISAGTEALTLNLSRPVSEQLADMGNTLSSPAFYEDLTAGVALMALTKGAKGTTSGSNQIANGAAANAGAQIGTKLDYVFGKATGSVHNIERSTGMLRQLESIGVFDNTAGRSLLQNHLETVYSNTKGIRQSNGRYLRESLLMGPNGGLKVESIWEENKLITVKLLGDK